MYGYWWKKCILNVLLKALTDLLIRDKPKEKYTGYFDREKFVTNKSNFFSQLVHPVVGEGVDYFGQLGVSLF